MNAEQTAIYEQAVKDKPLLEVYRQKAEQRMLKGDPTQNIGEGSKGEAIEQFATAVHSNPETVRQALPPSISVNVRKRASNRL